MSSDSNEHFSLIHPNRFGADDSVEGEASVNICNSPVGIKMVFAEGPGKYSD